MSDERAITGRPPQALGASPLRRLLEAPDLAAAVQRLPALALGRVIEQVGLEDAGELVALATTDQLTHLLDHDVWRADRAGADEAFDAERFALWLEVMLEAGDAFTANRVTELDPDLLTLALCKLCLVVDDDRLRTEVEGDEDEGQQIEKALESSLCHELGSYLVIARKPDAWDAVFTLLIALDQSHHDFLERLLDRACHVSTEQIDDGGGLHAVLTADETVAADAGAAREGRRAQAGFVAPADARAFLALARQGSLADALSAADEDPVTRAYFREFTPAAARPVSQARPATARTERLLAAVVAAGVDEAAGDGDAGPVRGDVVVEGLAELRARDPARHERRLYELNYLANVLIAGAAIDGRQLRPVEAGEVVLELCRRGLAELGSGDLAKVGVVKAFRVGWHLVQHAPDPAALPALLRRLRG